MSEGQAAPAELSAERKALLALLAERHRHGIPRAERSADLLASFAQQRLWFIDRLQPGNPAYNCPIAIRLRGPLRVEALHASINDLIERHEVLRTTFSMRDAEVLQHIHPRVRIELPVTDLTGLPAGQQDSAITEAVVADAHEPFDLVAGPVIRARLLRLGAEDHVLLYDIHHIANDGWSVGVFFTELAELYNARLAGREPQLPPLEVQYADYALWQRNRLTGQLREQQLSYWRTELDGLAPLGLPTDRPRPATLSTNGGVAHLPLPPDLVAGLRELGRAEGATLFVTLMAALHVLLMRYSGETDIGVGTAYTDRDRAELQNLIGFFPNTVVIRADLDGAPGFRSALRAIRAKSRAAFEHADLPFDVLVGELSPRRDSSRNPYFDVFFTLDETPESPPEFTGLAAESLVPDFLTAKFDLGFTVRMDEAHPAVHCIYSSDLYEPATIESLLRHYRTLLESILADPDRPVTELDLLPEPEWHRILVEWNDTRRRLPVDQCLHEPVLRRAAEQPDLPAVICGQQVISYQELATAAGELAGHLNRLGVTVGDIVGVCLPRGPERIVALLGVLISGAAYLPLDPDYPAERLAFLLSDSASWGVLTTPELRDRLAGSTRLLTLAELAERAGQEPAEAAQPARRPTPEDLAYVIYTSGSTGAPKGIALRHRGALNNFADFNSRFEIGPGDAVLGVSSPSFDMSMYDSVGMLGAGGTLVLPEPGDSRDPARWIELIAEHQITVWHSAPALLTLVLDRLAGTRRSLDSLRLALLGGDWIPVSMPDRLRAQAPRVRFIALGGATEASMDSTLYEVEQTDPDWASIPYGRPMANQRTYVLDRNLQPVPPGVPGELYLAGAGLAREYLHRPELTAERFLEHTFAPGFTERLYRTGDLVRLGRDGVLELLGRVDFQVKVHGLRIEPGEIESVLRRHSGVAAAVVVARGERGEASLVAYYTGEPGQPEPADDELRDWVAASLPSFMVPSAFVRMAELPTTPNGKVDRAGLRELRVAAAGSGEAPRDELEARIAETWRAALDLDELSIDDNFFAVGGDSFTAIRVMHSLDADLPVVELFTHPSVRALAARLRERTETAEQLLYQLTPPRPALVSLVCVPYGGGNAIAYQPLADQLPEDWALWSVALPGHDAGAGEQRFAELNDVARRCAEEVLARISGPLVVYGQCAGSATAVRLAQELEDRGADVRAVYIGAALPDPDPESSLRLDAETTDEQVHSYLTGLGGFDGMLDDSDLQAILRAVRHDLRQASGFFLAAGRQPPRPLDAALHCVFGSADPATEGFEQRYLEWGRFGELAGRHVIEGGNHYFVRNDAAELAGLLHASYFDSMDDTDFFATTASPGGHSR